MESTNYTNLIFVFFTVFLVLPVVVLLGRSIIADGHISNMYFKEVLSNPDITTALMRSMKLSLITAVITSVLAFFAAYAIQTTTIRPWLKSYSHSMIILPMLVPTITYAMDFC